MLNLATKFAPTPEAFATAVAAGFRCVELWTDDRVLANWRQVAEWANRYDLRLAMHFPNQRELSEQALHNCVAMYQALGCRAMVMHQPTFDRHSAALLALHPSICLAIENSRLTPERLEQWFEQSHDLTLDVEHVWKFTLCDVPLAELLDCLRVNLARYGSKLRHVHMPGYWPGYDEHRPMYLAEEFVFAVFDLLAEMRYDGLIVSEIDLEYQNLVEMRKDVEMFNRWMQDRRLETGDRGIFAN